MNKAKDNDAVLLSQSIRGAVKPVAIAAPLVMVAGVVTADYLPITSEFIVNSDINPGASPAGGGHGAVAMDADGNFVAVWDQYYGGGNRGSFGYTTARVFNADGSPRTGNIGVSAGPATAQAAVAMDADGDFVVVWSEYSYISRGFGQNYGVFAQRFNASGVAQGPVITVDPQGSVDPSVAMDADGDFVVAWSDIYYDADRGSASVYVVAQRFSATGAPQGGVIPVSIDQGTNPSVVMDADGDFGVAWQNYLYIDRGGISAYALARLFDSSGSPTTGVIQVNDTATGASDVAMAMDADGDFGVAWSAGYALPAEGDNREFPGTSITAGTRGGGGYDIRARLFTAAGTPRAGSFLVQTSPQVTARSRTSIAMDADGDFAIAWASYAQDGQDDYDIYVRLFNADGTADAERPGETLVNQTTEGDQEDPSVTMDADGDFIVVWRANDGNPYAIIGSTPYNNDVGGRLFDRQAGAPLVIPTLSGIGLTVLGGALAGMGAWHARRRRANKGGNP